MNDQTADRRVMGRPRTFDENEALVAATEVFWRKGYEGASLSDLTEATRLNRPSLYGAFGNKERLFLHVLDHYGSGRGQAPILAFEAESDIRIAVRAFLEESLKNNTRRKAASGCLFASCAATSAETMPEVKDRLRSAFDETERRLAARFDREIENGSLSEGPAASVRARRVIDAMNAQAVSARAGASRKRLMDELDDRVVGVFAGGAA